MQRLRSSSAVFAIALFLALGAPLGAQGLRLEATGIYATLNGNDFTGTKAGIGFDVAGVFGLQGKLSLAAGVARTTHKVDGLSNKLAALQIYGEPRFTLSTSSAMMHPYLFLRGGYLRTSVSESGQDASATGFAFGGGAGMVFGGTGKLQFTLSAGFHKVSLGDAKVSGNTIPGSKASGTSLMVRGGVSIGFGS